MKKGYIVLIVIAVVVLSIFFWFKGAYNGMVNMREAVSAQWSNVENQYQRRLDLIPNLVNTVKGYASHEENTLTEVVNARAKATQMQLNIDQLDEAALKKLSNIQGELSSALSRLMAISENYPDLKANQNFLDLQAQLEGTENRIAVERRKFNDVARSYNAFILQEKDTSGEIRIHFENHCRKNVLDRAAQVFADLKMHKTALRNGVLIYVALEDKQLAILGDAGINAKVPDHFWDDIKNNMIEKFKSGQICEGVCEAVLTAGQQLKAFFPYQADDVNELSDDISFKN